MKLEIIKTFYKFSNGERRNRKWCVFVCPFCKKEFEDYSHSTKRSCGCSKNSGGKHGRHNYAFKHGKTNSVAFSRWSGMINRCTNIKSKDYPRYGGRGIFVCESWRIFENFYLDMGDPPMGKTLDRINNDGPYAPNNCRWATLSEQAKNRRERQRDDSGKFK